LIWIKALARARIPGEAAALRLRTIIMNEMKIAEWDVERGMS